MQLLSNVIRDSNIQTPELKQLTIQSLCQYQAKNDGEREESASRDGNEQREEESRGEQRNQAQETCTHH